MTLAAAKKTLTDDLHLLYDERESVQIADCVMEHITGLGRMDRMLRKDQLLTEGAQQEWIRCRGELLHHRPVQYVLGEAWFIGYRFYVNESVLIPRPETEELVQWVIDSMQSAVGSSQSATDNKEILDIGTGSGCIPISLKKKMPSAAVTSIDISTAALEVAQKNAAILEAAVNLRELNFLDAAARTALPAYDIIISNPPYVKQSEAASIEKHVLDYEPSLALFVPDHDALLFYRHIAAFGKTNLKEAGCIYVEINAALGEATVACFAEQGYQTTLRKDMHGNDRMLSAYLI
jgi:release factor glutamine methyltransferase